MKPLVLINFKTYRESSGVHGIRLAQQLSQIHTAKYQIAFAPAIVELADFCRTSSFPIYAQHCDPYGYGAHTGAILPAALKSAGASGTILNHAEHKIKHSALRETIALCKTVHLHTVACASTLIEIRKIAVFQPTFLAYEPAELIGGDRSVTDAKPATILKALAILKRISPQTKMLCGAGIHSPKDFHQALRLGAEGVLLAHAAVNATSPYLFLKRMLESTGQ